MTCIELASKPGIRSEAEKRELTKGWLELALGCVGKKNAVTALVDTDDIHCVRFVS